MKRKLRMGMVGGGRDAFIGAVHRMAAQMDGQIELVCGCFSSTPEKSQLSGEDLFLDPERVYGRYKEMFQKEAKRSEDTRMDFVCIVTPNNMHYPIAMAALDAGFHVVCDKPMTTTLDEAENLRRKVRQSKKLFCLTHNYTGNAMVKEARELVSKGKLGKIRRVTVEYPQGWMATRIEATGQKQAAWRTDPKRTGASNCMGDIGTHCANLAEYITRSEITEVCSDLTAFVKGRTLDDNGSVLLRFKNGARGVLWASQIAVGKENALAIRVYGEKGGLEWHQEEPNTLIVDWLAKPREYRRTATASVGKSAAANTRLPAGHPEGYLEAFANVYANFAKALDKTIRTGKPVKGGEFDFPSVDDGVRGIAFLSAVVESTGSKDKWVSVK